LVVVSEQRNREKEKGSKMSNRASYGRGEDSGLRLEEALPERRESFGMVVSSRKTREEKKNMVKKVPA